MTKEKNIPEALGISEEQYEILTDLIANIAKRYYRNDIKTRTDLAKQIVIETKKSFFNVEEAECSQYEQTTVVLAMKMQNAMTHTEVKKEQLLKDLLGAMPEELRGIFGEFMKEKGMTSTSCNGDCDNCEEKH